MARIRTIKPEFWTSEQVMDLSPNARLLFIGLWNFCDDAGIHPASLKRLKAELMPADDVRSDDVRRMIDECIKVGLLREYEIDGEAYWAVTGWHHQKIDQPSYKFPNEDGTVPDGPAKRRQEGKKPSKQKEVFAERSPPEGKGMESKGREGSRKEGKGENLFAPSSAVPPSPPVIGLPLNDGSDFPIGVEQVDEFAKLYPAVDVMQALRNMRAWSITNPTKRKTRSGVMRFVNGWLAKEQDMPKRNGKAASSNNNLRELAS